MRRKQKKREREGKDLEVDTTTTTKTKKKSFRRTLRAVTTCCSATNEKQKERPTKRIECSRSIHLEKL